MILVASGDSFSGASGAGASNGYSPTKTFVIERGDSDVELQIETPDGWLTLKTYTDNQLDKLDSRTHANFQFAYSGTSKVWVI